MNTSIQISASTVEASPRTAKGEVVKLVQGAPLIVVAAVAVAGIASVAAPFCVWKGEVALFLNESSTPTAQFLRSRSTRQRHPGPIGRRCSWPCSSRPTLPTMPSGAFARGLGSAAKLRCSAGACRALLPR